MKNFKKLLSLVLALTMCFSLAQFSIMEAFALVEDMSADTLGAISEPAFTLDVTAPETVIPGDTLNVVFTIKNITAPLDAITFILDYDETKLEAVYTTEKEMNKFMTTSPMYIMEIDLGDSVVERTVTRYEQISLHNSAKGSYTCRFLDQLDYEMAKEGQIFEGLSNDGDLVITIPFRVKETVKDKDSINFSVSGVAGTTTKTLISVVGSANNVSSEVAIAQSFVITFVDENDNVISSKTYEQGATVEVPNAPVKEADKTYTYTFAGWDKEVVKVNGDATYKATYTSNYIDYTVKFVDEKGNLISEKKYHYGDTVEVPNAPVKEADKTYTYTFAGWDKEVVKVNGDATYKATYTSNYIDYTVKFVDEKGNVISEKKYHYGDIVEAPKNPQKATDKIYSYTFVEWDKEIKAVEKDETYIAKFKRACACFAPDEDFYLDVDTEYMPNIVEKTTVAQLKDAFKQKDITVTVYTTNGDIANDGMYVGTGFKVTDEMGYTYTAIILGDVDGNGEIDSTDYLRIKGYFLKTYTLEGEYLVAANVYKDETITSTDYLQIKSHFLGILNIFE